MINWNNSNSNWKILLGFRNMQEKLEMVFFLERKKVRCVGFFGADLKKDRD